RTVREADEGGADGFAVDRELDASVAVAHLGGGPPHHGRARVVAEHAQRTARRDARRAGTAVGLRRRARTRGRGAREEQRAERCRREQVEWTGTTHEGPQGLVES